MTLPSLSVSADNPLAIEADVLVIGVRKTDDGPVLVSDEPAALELQPTLKALGITGGQDEFRRLSGIGGASATIALLGLGTAITPNDLRYAAGSALRQLRGAAT